MLHNWKINTYAIVDVSREGSFENCSAWVGMTYLGKGIAWGTWDYEKTMYQNSSDWGWVFTICQFVNEYLQVKFCQSANLPMSTYESTILGYGHQKDILEIKKCLLVKCDRPVLNNNISSAKLFLFDIN